MTTIRVLIAALLCCSGAAFAASDGFAPPLDALDAVPRFTTDGAAVAKALGRTVAAKGQPLRYAVAADLPLAMADGRWDEVDADTQRWRLRVASAGAKNLSVEFARFHLPDGAALYIYDTSGARVQGPYTAADNPAGGRLWTAMIDGSEAVIEARVPRAKRDALQVGVAGVMHGFLDFRQMVTGVQPKSLSGDSAGSCEINVACSQGNNWLSEIRSVGAYTIRVGKDGVACSGQMINDVPQDGAPYFLTANHCQIDSQSVADSMVVYWNYQAASCDGTTGPTTDSQTGSTLFAGDVGSDFTLVRLARVPPTSYNVYYAGLDASGSGASSGVGIHHPEGDIKKISTFTSAAVQDQLLLTGAGANRTIQAWRVNWASGVTEEGSSGSGLWNQNHRIIGVLSGGASSCANPGGEDYYGRLNVAWTAQSSQCGQLKASLDPANTGSRITNGAEASSLPGSNLPAAPGCAGVVSGTGGGSGGGALPPVLLAVLLGGVALRRRRS